MVANSDAYTVLKAKLENLPENVVVIGSHTQLDNRKEKVCLTVGGAVHPPPPLIVFILWGTDA